MKTIFNIIIVLTLLVNLSCDNKYANITNSDDYNKFLTNTKTKNLDLAKYEIDFWQKKFNAAPNQFSYLNKLAANYSNLFELTGNIDYLHKAETLLLKSNEALLFTNVGTIRSLARIYITQHKFKEALILANKALKIGEEKFETQKLLFDIQMELGNYNEAKKNLIAIGNFNEFDFLIRVAKWNDHLGDLDTAIKMMEKAAKIAIQNNNEYLMVWTYSNLGDMYGHAGNIEKSYKNYLKALELNPEHVYSLKGIAWIVFSFEKNSKEAKRMIDLISLKNNSPDYILLKSQMAEFENNKIEKEKYLGQYFQKVNNEKYGDMYNKYSALLYSENNLTLNKALRIAETEVNNRPTPESYDLLAWSYYKMGNKHKALKIASQFVESKTFEPKTIYHLAMIYKANKLSKKVKSMKRDLQESLFELGPTMIHKIEML